MSTQTVGNTPTRTIRVNEQNWNTAKQRAHGEGTTISQVIGLFVAGYAAGELDAPETRVGYPEKAKTQRPRKPPLTRTRPPDR